MTEFTSDEIKKMRNSAVFLGEPGCQVFREALDEIERLQALVSAHENDFILLELNDMLKEKQARVQELEIYNKDFHLACINALDLHRESDVPKLKDIPKIIEELRTRVQELEQERRWIPTSERNPHSNGLFGLMLKESEALRAENERLREALREIANSAGEDACGYTTGEGHSNCIWKARQALNEVTK